MWRRLRSIEILLATPDRDNHLIDVAARRFVVDESDRTVGKRQFQ
jgi:hypothetical protein